MEPYKSMTHASKPTLPPRSLKFPGRSVGCGCPSPSGPSGAGAVPETAYPRPHFSRYDPVPAPVNPNCLSPARHPGQNILIILYPHTSSVVFNRSFRTASQRPCTCSAKCTTSLGYPTLVENSSVIAKMSSHYQQYLKAIGQQDGSRSVSSPSPSAIARKPANRSISPVISSPIQPLNGSQSPSTQTRSISATTPASTAPSSINNFPHPPPSPLASHPPDRSPRRPAREPIVAHDPMPTAVPSNIPESVLKTFTNEQTSAALATVLKLLTSAVSEHEKRPFAAILLGPDNSTILLSQFSISPTRRAETELARSAAEQYSPSYLSRCTLVSAWEPCPMSAGTIYLSGIGRVLYAASESRLKDISLSEDTMSLPCRTIFSSGSREVEVAGPIPEWETKVVHEASSWLRRQNSHETLSKAPSIRSNGTGSAHGQGERMSVVTTWTHEDSVLSSIGEDGEYKADLDIDWMK